MGKRSNFPKRDRMWYPTPPEAVAPLVPYIPAGSTLWEPCAGDGRLGRYLAGACSPRDVFMSDIHPLSDDVAKGDAVDLPPPGVDLIVTNPPWQPRPVLHGILDWLRLWAPTWLLLDADWSHTVGAGPHMRCCHKVVSVGRVKWIEGSTITGKENCAWYLFEREPAPHGGPIFFGRRA